MTFEEKVETTIYSTVSFIDVISVLNDEPTAERPFFAPLTAFLELTSFLTEMGWTHEELADMLKMAASEDVTN
jgi:hypothetical protein